DDRAPRFLYNTSIAVTAEADGWLLHDPKTGRRELLDLKPTESLAVSPDGKDLAIFDGPRSGTNRMRDPKRVFHVGDAIGANSPNRKILSGWQWTTVLTSEAESDGRSRNARLASMPSREPQHSLPIGENATISQLPIDDGTVLQAQWGGAINLREGATGK